MLKVTPLIYSCFFVLFISSCTTHISDYKESQPTFDIKRYFNGEMLAWGMVQDYSNLTTRRFCVELKATWQENIGELAETFYFNDGEISYRTWKLTQLPQGKYSGTAEDVVGVAHGEQSGFAFQWQYQLLVPIDEDIYTFTMDDWMYQIDQERVMNKTSMSKLGVKVAEITLFFDKASNKKTCR
ncbi:DUF3833 domain-containing protein [Colwelliaceae bacterium 6441]